MTGNFPNDWLEELFNRNDIVSIASGYTLLKQSGHDYTGLCPLHNEKSASFHVNSEKQVFYCFGCQKGGTVIDLVKEYEHIGFREAVEYLAQKVNLSLPQSGKSEEELKKERDLRERQYDLNRMAAMFYHQTLLSDEGMYAREYLYKRGIDDNTIKRFGLGYSPDRWDGFKKYASDNGYSEEELSSLSLLVKKDNSSFDMFRNRIMFPIINVYSKVIGFGGRTMEKIEPKYLNSSENKIFNKGSNLYALNIARKNSKLDSIILCEGYIDVIALHQYGFSNAVASLGTAFTNEQMKLIKRYTDTVLLSYDGDKAGQNATMKALNIISKAGMRARILQYPDGMDPDDYIRKDGAEGMQRVINLALSEIDYRLKTAAKGLDLNNKDVHADYAITAIQALKDVSDPIQREAGLLRISEQTGFTLDTLYQQMGDSRSIAPKSQPRIYSQNNIKSLKTEDSASKSAEARILILMLDDKQWRAKILSENWLEYFVTPLYRRIYEILTKYDVSSEIKLIEILSQCEDEEKAKITLLFGYNDDYGDKAKLYKDCKRELKINKINIRIEELKSLISSGEVKGEELRSIVGELQKCNIEYQMLKKA